MTEEIIRVPGVGPKPCRWMIIGEAPGADEVAHNPPTPFVGQAGRLLNKCLSNVGLNRSDFYITNILKWRPPYNRDPLPHEIREALPELMTEILSVAPGTIVPAGRFATAIFVTGRPHEVKMKQYHIGKNTPFLWHNRLIVPIYHPAYGVRSGGGRALFVEDIHEMHKYLTGQKFYVPLVDEEQFQQWRKQYV